jgi:hypothetical protein
MSTIITHSPIYEFFDEYMAYQAKKQEVLDDESYPPGTRIVLMTSNQEGCESAILEIIDEKRTLTIIRYDDL